MSFAEHTLTAVRIKDGIFVGNAAASQDEDFLVMNKVTHIVNCAGAELGNHMQGIGIQYLTFPWRDLPNTILFDSADRNAEQIFRFMDKGLENGDCVLVHSVHAASRSCAVVAAYLTMKYGWTVDHTLSFMALAHPDMAIKPHFMRQLRQFAKRHDPENDVFDSVVDDSKFALDNDQWMLRNTYINSLSTENQMRSEVYRCVTKEIELDQPLRNTGGRRRKRITFTDTRQGTVMVSATVPLAQVTQLSDFSLSSLVDASALSPIVARRCAPNRRLLESPAEVNAKGRQMLELKETVRRLSQTTVNQSVSQTQPKQGEASNALAGVRAYISTNASAPSQADARTPVERSLNPNLGRTAGPVKQSEPSAASKLAPPPSKRGQSLTSPFVLNTNQPRRGSPLPQGTRRQSGPTTSQPSSARRSSPVRSNDAGSPAADVRARMANYSNALRRTNSPQSQRTSSPGEGRLPSQTQPRPASPMQRTDSPRRVADYSFTGRSTTSARPSTLPASNTTIRSFAQARDSTTGDSTTKSRISYSSLHSPSTAPGPTSSRGNSPRARPGSPGQRPLSPMSQRPTSSRTGSRTNSPVAQPVRRANSPMSERPAFVSRLTRPTLSSQQKSY